jgi:hypothetical protein
MTMLISICNARISIRQHPLHARKIPTKSGDKERVGHPACPERDKYGFQRAMKTDRRASRIAAITDNQAEKQTKQFASANQKWSYEWKKGE